MQVLNIPHYEPQLTAHIPRPIAMSKSHSSKKNNSDYASTSTLRPSILHFLSLVHLTATEVKKGRESCKVDLRCICSLKSGQPTWEFYLERKDCWRISHSLGGRRGHCFMEARKALEKQMILIYLFDFVFQPLSNTFSLGVDCNV